MRIVCEDGSPIQQGDIADPMTWNVEDHESTEGSLQFLTASEVYLHVVRSISDTGSIIFGLMTWMGPCLMEFAQTVKSRQPIPG